MVDQLLERFARGDKTTCLLDAVHSSNDNLVVSELRGGATPAVLALIHNAAQKPVFVLTSSLDRAEALTDGLQFFGLKPFIFPAYDTLPFEPTEPVLHILSAQWRAIARLLAPKPGSEPPIIVAPIDAILFRTRVREALERDIIDIAWGQKLDVDDLARRLVAMGYEREALVESPGEFSIRGSIMDVYPPDADLPWRLDLFGEDIEQIRQFDPVTQRSRPRNDEIESIRLLPATIQAPRLAALESGEGLGSFFDLLPPETLLVRDGPTRIEQRMIHFGDIAARHWNDIHRTRPREDEPPNFFAAHDFEPGDWLLSSADIEEAIARHRNIDFADLAAEETDWPVFPLATQSFQSIPSQFAAYVELIRERLRKNHRVMIVCDNNGQVMRLDELLREHEIPAMALDQADRFTRVPDTAMTPCPEVQLAIGELHEGFHCPAAGMFVVTDREIFGRYKRRHIYRRGFKGKAVTSPTEIKRGDYVVHMEHGIGVFEGIRRQEVDGKLSELLELTYQDGDKLLVPVDKLHMVQKYAGADGKAPALDKLGGKRWQSRKKKSMEAVRKMAGELLALYARRAAAEGHASGPDTVWLREFEASFIYEETPDQLEAIEAVKQDMMSPKPMDRLVCGDVGYGKTEIAIRAAFKALTEKRQVALLAPTTLLAQQHFTTFTERFADYPFKVAAMSRFTGAEQQSRTIEQLAIGGVDLVIGTHRLLSRDVKFKDLGLLIIDEEQRFGVAQKEKIKALRENVDVLTLTATPIPRTLYMALSGLRDLSVINTPPADRHPIKTRTIHWDREALEEAILRELNRGGQVYFVHNRIESIQDIAKRIHDIVPQARLVVAHGQTDDRQLEKIMLDFINGKYDILVSTTIIENGIDIPNVNTIIINRADAMGLAQLYQLRGRVGRDVRQAYAYLVLPPGQAITPQAVRRLEALEEFTELGVGFQLAMRDMEIRGTGSLLGSEQHGAIADIGFEMYCQMLEEAVNDLKGQEQEEPLWPVEVKWPVDQFFPDDYIPVESQRIRFYKDVASARHKEELDALLDELVDRYGQLPQPAVGLIDACRVRLAASPWRIDIVRHNADTYEVRLTAPVFSVELATALAERASAARGTFTKLRRLGDSITLEVRDDEDISENQILSALADLLEALPNPE
ncbi:transcription-repair coupling factor [bacterium]|nr:transcription-repair coupling factor [bacterium]